MGKRDKKAAKRASEIDTIATESALATRQCHPKKQPVILAISIVLFALWFVFLLLTAVFG
jgi:hypothetical protein